MSLTRSVFPTFVFLAVIFFSEGGNVGYAQLKAGSVYPGAKVLDAELLNPFSGGAAVIEIGRETALIDAKGNYIVPYGKYKMDNPQYQNHHLGLFEIETDELANGGFINDKGKLVYTPPAGGDYVVHRYALSDSTYLMLSERRFSKDGLMTTADVLINAQGRKFSFLGKEIIDCNEGIVQFRDKKSDKMGYCLLSGQVIIEPRYYRAMSFHQGLAAVAENTKRGDFKWNFINTKGQMVIPGGDNYDPGFFTNGLAALEFKDDSNYAFGFINKLGDTVVKVPHTAEHRHHFRFISFRNGYFLTDDHVFDLQGTQFSRQEFLGRMGVDTAYTFGKFDVDGNQVKIDHPNGGSGLFLLDRKLLVAPVFYQISYFDPISGLAYAKLILSRDTVKKIDTYREGYIDDKGIFVMYRDGSNTYW